MEKVHGKATEKIISKSVREKSGKKSVYKKRGRKPVIKSTLENKGNYECTMCEKIFESVNEFSDHVLSHDVDTCFLCGHKLKSKTDKRRHVTRPVTLKESQCFTCGLKFSLLSEFQEHMNGHSELCRLEECLKNAENLHNLSKEIVNSTQPSDSSKTYDSEENTLFKAMEVMHDHDATDQVQVMDEDIMESCNVSLKEHDFCGEDNHPDTAVLEIEAVHDEISGHHSLRSSNVTSSELKKKSTVTHTLDASLTTSIKEKSSSIKEFSNRRNSYRMSSVSPPRTRGSLKKDITVDEISIVKNIENKPIKKEKSPKKTAKKKDLECEDNKDFVHDLAASYSIYVKNMLRLQPVEKQMAMIKAINSAIAHFISD
ncbi:hypothetical protein SK128_009478 [Halocaridina rubra]|uniref:C2H2-type domain-containing protein n=1 Tax=Halocaridina rubra TaxID=373956 RepID=A0AAN8WXH0_HALRR